MLKVHRRRPSVSVRDGVMHHRSRMVVLIVRKRDRRRGDGRSESTERGGKEDVGTRLLLDGLDDVTLASGDNGVELVVDLTDLRVKTALRAERRLAVARDRSERRRRDAPARRA